MDRRTFKQIEYENMTLIQEHANHLWKFSSRYLDNMREGETYGNKFLEHMLQVKEALVKATNHSIECNHEFAKTRKRKARSGESVKYEPPTRGSHFTEALRMLAASPLKVAVTDDNKPHAIDPKLSEPSGEDHSSNSRCSTETQVKPETQDTDADDINEAQDEAAEAGETRGNKRRYGVANET